MFILNIFILVAKALSTTASTAAFDKNPQSKERGITLDLGKMYISVRKCLVAFGYVGLYAHSNDMQVYRMFKKCLSNGTLSLSDMIA